MANQRIDFNHTRTWTVTENNAVGPTTSMTLRTLDNTTPTNLNAVFLAPNGSDAGANGNAGTGISSAPVLTWEKAIDVMIAQPTRNTMHIFDNGSGLPLEFVCTDVHTTGTEELPTGSKIQVELGRTATIRFTTNGQLQTTGAMSLNGLYIVHASTKDNIITHATGKTEWCQFSFDLTSTAGTGLYSGGTLATCRNNIFDLSTATPLAIVYPVFKGGAISRCVITDFSPSDLSSSNAALFVTGAVDHCTFHNNAVGLTVGGTPNIKNSIFNLNGLDILIPTIYRGSETITNNLFSTSRILEVPNPPAVPFIIDILDDTNLSGIALFYSNEDFRIQDERRLVPGTTDYWLATSKGVYNTDIGQEPSDDGDDLGAYDVTVTLDTDTWEQLAFCDEYWNKELIITRELVNHQNFFDIRGNYRRAFDAPKRRITMGVIPTGWVGTQDSYKLLNLMEASGAKRWYPEGDDGMFSTDNVTITAQDDGTFLAPITATPTFVNNSYRGYVCLVSSGAAEFELRIRSHAGNTLVLEDHRETQAAMVAGVYDVTCLYLPVEIDQASADMIFEGWVGNNNALVIPATANRFWEGNVRELVLRETEEDV